MPKSIHVLRLTVKNNLLYCILSLPNDNFFFKKINFALAKPAIFVYTPLTRCYGSNPHGRVAQW